MAILHNGKVLTDETDILLEKWKLKSVVGLEEPPKPTYCLFKNSTRALKLIHKHIENKSKIVLHTDVDVDGIGTTYILKKALTSLSVDKLLLLINRDKIHGIQLKHVKYFETNPIDLIIITDSSCNEIDIIKQFNCDVLVIDHHDLVHNELQGKCNDGVHDWIIVNNTIDNDSIEDKQWLISKNNIAFNNIEDYKGTNAMSCGLVLYEFLRLYYECYNNIKLLENLDLQQWAGVTLYTDVIDTLNDRNQWYLNKTVMNTSGSIEPSLKIMMQNLNRFKASIDKSYIQYTFAPYINKAIRADEGARALDIVVNNPTKINDLSIYETMQSKAIDEATYVNLKDPVTGLPTKGKRVFKDNYIMLNISDLGIRSNYSGVIASRFCGDYNKNTAIYTILKNGKCKGSFRGIDKHADYRKYFDSYSDDIYAQGHPGAFGFELEYDQLKYLMETLGTIETKGENKPWLTLGNMTPEEYGVYHITSLDEFKKQGYIWRLAVGNAKVTSKDEIVIRVKASDVRLKDTKGKVFIYDVLGLECKAFKMLSGEYFNVYIEYTNEVSIYIN